MTYTLALYTVCLTYDDDNDDDDYNSDNDSDSDSDNTENVLMERCLFVYKLLYSSVLATR